MINVAELARGHVTAVDAITIELVETDETPAVVVIRWPLKPTALHTRRFRSQPAIAARPA